MLNPINNDYWVQLVKNNYFCIEGKLQTCCLVALDSLTFKIVELHDPLISQSQQNRDASRIEHYFVLVGSNKDWMIEANAD